MPVARIRVPATSANLGPGFDCLGVALTLHNELEVSWVDEGTRGHDLAGCAVEVTIEGEGADALPHDRSHLAVRALEHGLDALGGDTAPARLHLRQVNRVPLARGLGSSSAAIVAGLAAALALRGKPLDRAWLLEHAMHLEGHPDNVAPAIYGGATAAFVDETGRAGCLALAPPDLRVAVAIPGLHVSTAKARAALPSQIPLADAVFTISRAALLAASLASGRYDLLREACRDRLHTPYRAPLVGPFDAVAAAALEAGAAGVFISGSGPTMAAFTTGVLASAQHIAECMAAVFRAHGITARAVACDLDRPGVTMTVG
jgi:homoserine kinase